MKFNELRIGDYFSKEKGWAEDVYMKLYPITDHESFRWNTVCISGYARSMMFEFDGNMEVILKESVVLDGN